MNKIDREKLVSDDYCWVIVGGSVSRGKIGSLECDPLGCRVWCYVEAIAASRVFELSQLHLTKEAAEKALEGGDE